MYQIEEDARWWVRISSDGWRGRDLVSSHPWPLIPTVSEADGSQQQNLVTLMEFRLMMLPIHKARQREKEDERHVFLLCPKEEVSASKKSLPLIVTDDACAGSSYAFSPPWVSFFDPEYAPGWSQRSKIIAGWKAARLCLNLSKGLLLIQNPEPHAEFVS